MRKRIFQFGVMGNICLFMIIVILLMSIFAPLIAPHDPLLVSLANKFQPPSFQYWLGTDQLGRCILSRLIYGIRATVLTSLLAMLATILFGSIIGIISGYFGGKIDSLLMRICDIVLSFPSDVMIIAIIGIISPSLFNIIITIVAIKWAWYARIIRSAVLRYKHQNYIYFAKIHHASFFYIMSKHLLPSIGGEILALATINIGGVILMISALSFLGLGIQAPTPEWGTMLSEAKDYLINRPYLMLPAGLAITLTVIIFNYLGDIMQEKINQKSSTRHLIAISDENQVEDKS